MAAFPEDVQQELEASDLSLLASDKGHGIGAGNQAMAVHCPGWHSAVYFLPVAPRPGAFWRAWTTTASCPADRQREVEAGW